MKYWIFLYVNLLFVSFCSAQNQSVDNEKLLDFYQSQRYREAANYLTEVYGNDSNNPKILGQIGYCLVMSNQLQHAEQVFLRLDSIKPNQIGTLFNLSNIYSRRGNHKQASKYLTNIVKIDSTNLNALKKLGDLTDSLSLKKTYFEKAHKLAPNDGDIAYELADIYTQFKDYLPAYTVLKTAIAADTANYTLQGSILYVGNQLKKYTEVVEIGNRLINSGNADDLALKDVGKAYFFLKQYNNAIKCFKMFFERGKKDEITLYYTTIAYRELGDTNNALNFVKQIFGEAISPNTATYYGLQGSIYETAKKYQSAIKAYKRGLTFESSGFLNYRLAILYDSKLNQYKTAATYYKTYLASKDLTKEDKEQVEYAKSRISATTTSSQATQK